MRQNFYDPSQSVEWVAQRLTMWAVEDFNLKWPAARAYVARKAGLAPGALERLENRRLKWTERLWGPLNDLLIKELERRIAALEHDLAVARAATPAGPAPADVAVAVVALETARKALRG